MCRGRWYRIDVEQRPVDRGFAARVRARLLKSESCPGCPECAEIIRRAKIIGKGAAVRNLQHVEHGRKYRLRLTQPSIQNDPTGDLVRGFDIPATNRLCPGAPSRITRLPVLRPEVAWNITRILGSNRFFVKGENLVSECGHHRFSPEIFGTTIAGLKDHDRVILVFREEQP
jgi:hypothetical protein